VVHELYVPNEIRQEFLFVAMTYAVGSLAFKCYEILKNLALFVLTNFNVVGCVYIVRKLPFLIFSIFSPYCNTV
jgi:hypothetical protein